MPSTSTVFSALALKTGTDMKIASKVAKLSLIGLTGKLRTLKARKLPRGTPVPYVK